MNDPHVRKPEQKANIWKYVAALFLFVAILLLLASLGVFETQEESESSSSASTLTSEVVPSPPHPTQHPTLETLSVVVETTVTPGPTQAPESTTSEAPESTTSEETSTDAYEELTYLTGAKQPNIVFLLADDLGMADLSFYGGRYSTPFMDNMIMSGVEFSNFYSHALCTPSRVSMLTGRYSWRMGVQYPEVMHGMMSAHIPMDEATFAEVTREFGYNNYYVGRWGVGYASWDFTPLGRGWDKFFGYFGPEGGYYNHSTDHFTYWTDVYDMWDDYEVYYEGNGTYSEEMFGKRFMEMLDLAVEDDKPFTLTYASQTGHAPIDDDETGAKAEPPITYEECVENDPMLKPAQWYCNKVKYLDEVWQNLTDYMHELKYPDGTSVWENTIVFMTSDNGGLPFTGTSFGGWGCNWPLRGGKVTHYEGGIHVWAAMNGGLLPKTLKGTQHTGLTHITDFGATAMRLAMPDQVAETGISWSLTDKALDGNNLWELQEHDLVIHSVPPQYMPSWIFGGVMDFEELDFAATDGEWKYLKGLPDTAAMGQAWYRCPGEGWIDAISDPDLWIEAGTNCSHGCLFHIPSDPYEYKDLSSDYTEVRDWFADAIYSIWLGTLDEDYHPGQNYAKDYRGYWADDIIRPYLDDGGRDNYQERMIERTPSGNYSYEMAEPFWFSDCPSFTCDPFGNRYSAPEDGPSSDVLEEMLLEEELLYDEYLETLAEDAG